jgi:HEAT repeat protein
VRDNSTEASEETIKSLVTNLASREAPVRIHARKSLAGIGNPAVPYLVNALSSRNDQVRFEAAKALQDTNARLGDHATPDIIELLIGDLASTDGIVRIMARRTLVSIGGKAIDRLLDSLKSKNKWVRWEAAKALGQIGGIAAIHGLVKALDDKMFDVRWIAAEALIHIGGRKVIIQILNALVEHPDSYWTREAVHHVLHDINKEHMYKVLKPVLVALEDVEPALEAAYAAENALNELAKM